MAGTARTGLRHRRDGVPSICRATRPWWRTCAIVVGGTVVLLLLALSAGAALVPALLALPPMALGIAVWLLFRSLDAPRAARLHQPSPRVIPLSPRRRRGGDATRPRR